MPNHYIRPGDNPDITKERQTCTFDTQRLTEVLYGGAAAVAKRREISAKVAADPDFADPTPIEFLTRETKVEHVAKKSAILIDKVLEYVDPTDPSQTYHYLNEVIGQDGSPLALHHGMFIPALTAQADDELASEFLPRALRHEILGTYAQTEMGHGTSLRELETTAHYDKKTQEFILNTPTRSAMKWWPGNLGKMTNYAVVTARLFLDGKNLGPHNFLVQLRCEKTHKPLKGVTIGDIGPKFSYNTTDNGFLALDHIRIPRKNMLSKHSKVSADGTYTAPMHDKINYSAMVHVRTHMIFGQGYGLGHACIVALRYSAVRRQGRIDPKQPEVQILDYQTQQHRLFPQIARAYAFMFTGLEVRSMYEKSLQEIAGGNADLLPDLHAVTSGLKSVVTHFTGQGIEQCRMSCGGHGYSMASGLPQLYGVLIGGCTYEGENMVMLQQTARYLLKAVDLAAKGKVLSPSVAYLSRKDSPRSLIGATGGPDETKVLIDAVEHAARRSARHAVRLLKERTGAGQTHETAWNGVTVEMNRASRLYSRLFICNAFAARVEAVVDTGVRAVLGDLLDLFLHYELVDMAHHLLEDGYCNGDQIQYLKKKLYEDLAKIRKNAVSLVDSLDYSDRMVHSVLGRRDGNVYEALYKWARQSELNYTDVLPAHSKYIKPMMERNREASKL